MAVAACHGHFPGGGAARCICARASHSRVGASEYVRVDISSLPLADARTEFAEQAKLSIGETGVNFGRARSAPIDGAYLKTEALRRISSGSGFTFEFLDANTVRIKAAPIPRKNAAAREAPIESRNCHRNKQRRNQPRHPVLDRRDQRTPARGFRCRDISRIDHPGRGPHRNEFGIRAKTSCSCGGSRTAFFPD